MRKYLSSSIVLLSIAFLLYYLWSKKLLDFSVFKWNWTLLLSFFFLFAGFIGSGLSWWYTLKAHHIHVSPLYGIKTHGLPIFTKYIPGKVMTILGRAALVSNQTKSSVGTLSFISLKEQLVYLIVGLSISFIPSIFTYGLSWITLFLVLTILGLVLIVFNQTTHKILTLFISKIKKKPIDLPLISISNGLKLSYFNILTWLLWTLGFYFFGLSVSDQMLWHRAFVFPLGVTYGVLAILMPGGIGVRESIFTGYLTLSGMDLNTAITISVASRLWFMSGEVFIFIFSLVIRTKTKH